MLKPHTSEWFAELTCRNPQQAAQTAQLIKLAGKTEICSICGDTDSKVYVGVDDPELPLRLCDDCKRIQKEMYGSSFDLVE